MLPKKLAFWIHPLVLLGFAGCGLVSGDVADVNLGLPVKHYSFDVANLGLPAVVATLPAVACSTDSECSCPATFDCTGVTMACRSSSCAGLKRVQVPATVDLGNEAPSFKDVKAQGLTRFEFKELDYSVTSTLSVELPAVDIYLVPQGVTSATDSSDKLGTIPATPAGGKVSGKVVLVPGANDLFTQYATDWAKPFGMIASSELTLVAGQPLPAGKVDFTISGTVVAKPSL